MAPVKGGGEGAEDGAEEAGGVLMLEDSLPLQLAGRNRKSLRHPNRLLKTHALPSRKPSADLSPLLALTEH